MSTDTAARSREVTAAILVVDDAAANRRALQRVLTDHGYSVLVACHGLSALDVVVRERPDMVVTGSRMRQRDGFELCRAIKASAATRLTPVIVITAATEPDDRIRAIESGADDCLTTPINEPALVARIRALLRLKRFTDDLDSAEVMLRSLALVIEARDAYTDGHCERLAAYATHAGRRLGLGDEDLLTLSRGGYFHDLGKVALPDAILLKPGPLTRAEYERVKEHPIIGEQLCRDLRVLHRVRPLIRHHHERLDGSGYPDRLKGDAIPLLAQVIGIVDVFDAMTTTRPYRAALPAEDAYEALWEDVERGHRRRDLVEAFIASSADQQAAPAHAGARVRDL